MAPDAGRFLDRRLHASRWPPGPGRAGRRDQRRRQPWLKDAQAIGRPICQYLHHAQQAALGAARFNDDGSLDIWLPNQGARDVSGRYRQTHRACRGQVNISPLAAAFRAAFHVSRRGPIRRPSRWPGGQPPVKLIWSREEEFLRDHYVDGGGALPRRHGQDGLPPRLRRSSACGGPTRRSLATIRQDRHDHDGGLTGRPMPSNRRIARTLLPKPGDAGLWRSVRLDERLLLWGVP